MPDHAAASVSRSQTTVGRRIIRVRVHLSLVSAVLALTVVASACGGVSSPSSSTMPATSTTSVTRASTTTTPLTGAEDSESTDSGVDPETKTITIGLLADQTGLFSSLQADVVASQTVYWDALNAAGGIDGWTVQYIVEDTASNIAQHVEKYEEIRSEVLAISLSTGSSANLEALDLYKQDSMLVLPLSWYSGWAFPRLDGRVMLEQNTNYCIEAMNILSFVNDMEGRRIALATLDDAYGHDAGAGVKLAIDFYGMDLVYDGSGAVVPGQGMTQVIQGIVDSAADWTFLATNPSLGAEILGGSARSGYQGMFTARSRVTTPSCSISLLPSSMGPCTTSRPTTSAGDRIHRETTR